MQRLKWYDHISVNLFWLGLNIRNNSTAAVLMPFLVANLVASDVLNSSLGFINMIGLFIAMLVQPAFGILSDRSTSRFGRRRPYIFVGVLLDLVCLALIASSTSFGFLLFSMMLFQVSSNISHGALQGLIPDLVPEDQRGVASGVKSMFELLPLILVSGVIAPLVKAHFDLAVILTGVGTLVIMLLTMLVVKEKPLSEKPSIPLGPPMKRVLGMVMGIAIGLAVGLAVGGLVGGVAALLAWPLAGQAAAMAVLVGLGGVVAMIVSNVVGVWAGVYAALTGLSEILASGSAGAAGRVKAVGGLLLRSILGRPAGTSASLGSELSQHTSFTWWVVNRMLYFSAITSLRGFAAFFFMFSFKIDVGDAVTMTSNLFLLVGLCTILTALPGGWLAERFGYKIFLQISGVGASLGAFLLLTTIWLPNLVLTYISGIILGLATGLFITTNWGLGTRLAPREQAGRFLGISNLAGAGAGIVGAGLGGPVADILDRATPGLGYFVIFLGYGVLFILSTVSLRGVKEPR